MKKNFLSFVLSLGLILTVLHSPVLADNKHIPDPNGTIKCELEVKDIKVTRKISCKSSD